MAADGQVMAHRHTVLPTECAWRLLNAVAKTLITEKWYKSGLKSPNHAPFTSTSLAPQRAHFMHTLVEQGQLMRNVIKHIKHKTQQHCQRNAPFSAFKNCHRQPYFRKRGEQLG